MQLKPAAGTRVIGRFADGAAAITCKVYPNGGRAVLVAFNLGMLRHSASIKPWFQFFRTIFVNKGIPVDLDIWRFCFPMPENIQTKPQLPKMKCLTGNNFFWFDNIPQRLGNVQLPGATYRLSRPADFDKTGTTVFPFAAGNLTNRLEALKVPDLSNSENFKLINAGKLKLSMFTDTWKSPEPLSITFNFGKEVMVRQVKIFYSCTLPDGTISCNNEKIPFSGEKTAMLTDEIADLAELPNQIWGEKMFALKASVGEKVIDLPAPQKTSALTIHLGKRPDGEKMMLSEIEIWGE